MKDKKIEELKKHNCYHCQYAEDIPGNCHIKCTNPPIKVVSVGAGGNERWEEADKVTKEEENTVVRCIWPGSGSYPFCFDGCTVFGCSHFKDREQLSKEEGKNEKKNQ